MHFNLFTSLICFLFLLTVGALSTGCSRMPQYPDELLAIDSLIVSRPDSALALLYDMEPRMQRQSVPYQRYHQLLMVKARDKAYIRHESDSLILDLLSYYSNQGDPRLLPEVCYYAGRVTRDLGDAPQALDYFHKALNAMEQSAYKRAMKGNESAILDLQGKIYAQMGYLFRHQHLYDESIYSFEQAYRVDSINQDTIGMILDAQGIASVLILNKEYKKALKIYENAESKSLLINDSASLYTISCQKTSIYNMLNEYDKAQKALYKYPQKITKTNQVSVYSIKAHLYSDREEFDSAAYYFNLLLESNSLTAQSNANLWLGNQANLHGDNHRAMYYIRSFMNLQDTLRSLNNKEAITLSQSLYNYQLREKEISDLQIRAASLKAQSWMYIALAAIALLLFYIEHARRRKIKRQNDHLQRIIVSNRQHVELKQELTIASTADLKNSQTYKKIRQKCDNNRTLTKSDWREIETLYDAIMPEFLPKLRGIQSYNDTEWRLSLLTKMGFSWHEIATLVSLSYEAIHSSQSRLFNKVFKGNVTYRNWKDFINSL